MKRLTLVLCCLTAFAISGCFGVPTPPLPGMGKPTFQPKSDFPPPPRVKDYTKPGDCFGGSRLAADRLDLPDYPNRALRNGLQGWVIVKLNVRPDGRTRRVSVERSVPSGVFDSASRSAVRKWRFEPFTGIDQLEDCRVMLVFRLGEVSLEG